LEAHLCADGFRSADTMFYCGRSKAEDQLLDTDDSRIFTDTAKPQFTNIRSIKKERDFTL
jgi:hypothetical protein